MSQGRLLYLVGASEPGRDSLVAYARDHLGEAYPVMFAHRYITAPAATVEDSCIVLSKEEFALRNRHGLFAMTWQGNGRSYAIGREINYWLATGLSVVVRGPREHLAEALTAYPDLIGIWVTAEPGTRDFDSAAAVRIGGRPAAPAVACRVVRVRDGEPVTLAGEKLVALLVESSL